MRQAQAVALALLAALAPAAARAAEQPASEPVLRLLAPGRAPLKALRYRARPGQKAHVSMSISMAMTMSIGGQVLPTPPTPEMRCGLDMQVTDVTPQGDIHYAFQFGEFEVVAQPSVPPAVVEATRNAVAGVRGLRGRAVASSRGITREAEIKVPPDAPPQVRQMVDSLQQSMRQFSAPLPEEPVGAGARWDTTYHLTQNGITIDQTAHNELTSIDGDRGQLAVTLTQSAPPQRMATPNLPAGARADLVSLASSGEGTSTLDFTRLVPTSARVKLKMKMATRMQVGQEKPQEFDMTMDMSMSMTGR